MDTLAYWNAYERQLRDNIAHFWGWHPQRVRMIRRKLTVVRRNIARLQGAA